MEKSLAAVPADSLTRAGLAQLGALDIGATLDHATSIPDTTACGVGSPAAGYTVDTDTSGGQRFRVLRPHARGGLGAVYVALDAELNREVALKQILDKHADNPISRQRFLLEAEVTGGLEHPGIVPVYGLGTYSDGRPYYAMRFIRGDTLKEAIDRFHAGDEGWVERSEAHRKAFQSASQPVGLEDSTHPTRDPGRRSLELRKLLRRLMDVCNAIDYAHSRGVLHRDIKPGNIIVGKHGETLVVDWGLAKATGKSEPGGEEHILAPSSASGSSETLPGSTLGTPSYMSPEQARGDLNSLGPWSDVYSLGATLYCLLTGKPPIEGGEINELLRKVQRGEFRPPRQLDPSIDTALEAICLKAMALKPQGSLCHRSAPGRRHRAVDGRRARIGLSRAVDPDTDPLAEPPSYGGDGGRGRDAGGAGRDRGGAGCAIGGQRPALGIVAPRDQDQRRAGQSQRGTVPLQDRRAGPLRAGRQCDQDVPHRRQRGLPAQAGSVQGTARAALEVGVRLLRQARCLAWQGDGRRFAAGSGADRISSWQI